jgi:hypothetical protein
MRRSPPGSNDGIVAFADVDVMGDARQDGSEYLAIEDHLPSPLFDAALKAAY